MALLVLYNLLDVRNEDRWPVFGIGLLAIVASAALTVLSPVSKSMLSISETHGVLQLNYTPNLFALAIECGIVIVSSTLLLWQWKRLEPAEAQNNALVLKYIGLLGLAVSALCLLQIFIVQFGYGWIHQRKICVWAQYRPGARSTPIAGYFAYWRKIRALFLTSPGEPLKTVPSHFRVSFPVTVLVAVSRFYLSTSTKLIALSTLFPWNDLSGLMAAPPTFHPSMTMPLGCFRAAVTSIT